MKEHEVFNALAGGDEARPIDRACSRLLEARFGSIDEAWFLRCVKAVAGSDPREGLGEGDPLLSDVDLVRVTEDALRRVIAFLQFDAGFLHGTLLPYRLPLIVLSRFFRFHPQPCSRSRVLLSRWMWRGAVSSEHGNSSHADVAAYQDAVGGRDEHEDVQSLLARLTGTGTSPATSKTWNGRAKDTKIVATALVHLGPRCPTNGEPVAIEALQDSLDDNSIGDVFLNAAVELCDDASGAARMIAARVCLVKEELQLLHEASHEVLSSHAIDEEAADALRRRDATAFVEHRSRRLDSVVAAFVEERTGLGENDRPPIAAINERVRRVIGE